MQKVYKTLYLLSPLKIQIIYIHDTDEIFTMKTVQFQLFIVSFQSKYAGADDAWQPEISNTWVVLSYFRHVSLSLDRLRVREGQCWCFSENTVLISLFIVLSGDCTSVQKFLFQKLGRSRRCWGKLNIAFQRPYSDPVCGYKRGTYRSRHWFSHTSYKYFYNLD